MFEIIECVFELDLRTVLMGTLTLELYGAGAADEELHKDAVQANQLMDLVHLIHDLSAQAYVED